jgi:hypothetical protein
MVALCIGNDVAFAALDAFARVKASGTIALNGFDDHHRVEKTY